jgi:hypothetical protein
MADRYQDRPFAADGRGDSSRGDDPLAELARLIGQSDPRGAIGRANQPAKPRPPSAPPRDDIQQPAPAGDDGAPAAGPLPWMQRANRQEVPPEDLPTTPHPLQRHAPAQAAPEPDFRQAPPPFTEPAAPEPDPSRYDDALFGRLGGEAQDSDLDQAYSDDGYAYQEGYDDDTDELPRRRGGLVTVAAVLALVLVGTGGAFAYRTFFGSSRSGEPPIIRADAGPTKIMPANADGLAKVPDRMSVGDGTEKIVPREESPVDVDAQSGPRVVLPGLNQNGGLPPASSAVQSSAPAGGAGPAATTAGGANGTLSNNEPRRIKTFSVRGDQPDGSATPVASAPPPAKPAAALRNAATASRSPTAAANANASANAPLSLVPQGSDPAAESRTRVAAANPAQTAPGGAGSSGGYLVQISSQRNEADAQASYRALQGKFPAVLGSRAPVIKRADLGDKGVYYRAMVGPFDSPDEATQLCASLKTAGGQCVVQRN